MTDKFPSPYESHHGGVSLAEFRELGVDPKKVVDLSSNILAVTHPTEVRQAIASAAIEPYPDRDCERITAAISKHQSINPNRILVGNGCSALIHAIAAAELQPGNDALVVGPTFSEYERACRIAGANVHSVNAFAASDYEPPLDKISDAVAQTSFRIVWICNPNNPTGAAIDSSVLKRWVQRYPETLFVVDESYLPFADLDSIQHEEADNLIVLRSMTKEFAIAGVRLGYLVATPARVANLAQRRIPWSVNSVAQAAGVAVLKCSDHYQTEIASMQQEKSRLLHALREMDFQPLAGNANFFLLPVEAPQQFRARLLDGGVLVRDCLSFGINNCVRIAVRSSDENNRLLQAISGHSPRPTETKPPQEPVWDAAFREQLFELFCMRRDVRRFKKTPIEADALRRWIHAACLAPSVGFSQPWRFVSVSDESARRQIITEFEEQNEQAANAYDDQAATEYRKLKLSGLRESPEHLAVFVQPNPKEGRGLGRQTMPESVAYSVVAAIQNFWLAARSEGVGVGWVSVLRPKAISEILNTPPDWKLIAFLCVGYPEYAAQNEPELLRQGWQERLNRSDQWRP